jgi:hypothetical protein
MEYIVVKTDNIYVVKNKNKIGFFPFNNQPDALIIQIYSVIKLYMFRATSLPIIRSFLLFGTGKFHAGFFLMTASKQSQDGTAPE